MTTEEHTVDSATRALEDAITLVAGQADAQGVRLTRTKLVKLLYFVDLAAWKRFGRTVTGVEWVWHHYGPYSGVIISACERMSESGEITERVTNNYYGSPQYDIESREAAYYERPSRDVVALVRSVVSELGSFAPAKIGDMSYDTEPMKRHVERGGARGDVIEFPAAEPSREAIRATVRRYTGLIDRDDPSRDEGDVAEGLRDEGRALAAARKSAGTRTLGDP